MSSSGLEDILMESGLDVLSKINNVAQQFSDLGQLDSKLLPSLDSNSIVEISGASRTGKTILVLKYITKLILPITHNCLEINGLELNVLLVDMELKFIIRILIEELEYYLNQCINRDKEMGNNIQGDSKQAKIKQDLISEIIQDSLTRLHVVYCHDTSENLSLIFQSIETRILSKQLSLDVVIIENVLNYYFEDVSIQICSIAKYLHKILNNSVLKYLKKFNILLMYTRYISLPQGRLPSNIITHSLQLHNINYYGVHKCVVNCDHVFYYRIQDQDFVWTEFNEETVDKSLEKEEEKDGEDLEL